MATKEHGAIKTRYKGILFRSKLEADWAITFDTLGIKWSVERVYLNAITPFPLRSE